MSSCFCVIGLHFVFLDFLVFSNNFFGVVIFVFFVFCVQCVCFFCCWCFEWDLVFVAEENYRDVWSELKLVEWYFPDKGGTDLVYFWVVLVGLFHLKKGFDVERDVERSKDALEANLRINSNSQE